MDAGDRRIVLVTRRTRLEELVARYNTVEQARFQAEHLGMDFSDFIEEDRRYQATITRAGESLAGFGRLQRLERGFLPNFLFPADCVVVVVGQDGLVANTLKYLDGQPVLAINPDPQRWQGVLLPFQVDDLDAVMPEVLKGLRKTRDVTLAQARLSDGQSLLAVNDLFIGLRGHASARYEIAIGDRHERHSSSGVIVSTGLGSTGWLRSILTGGNALAAGRLGNELENLRKQGMRWDSDRLMYYVREPYPSPSTGTELVVGRVSAKAPLRIRSLMPEGGVIFSDGMEADGLDFRSGLEAVVTIASRKGRLLQ